MKSKEKKVSKFLYAKFVQYGLHVGGLKVFWNPKVKVYVAGFRNGFGILDLNVTHRNMRQALKFLSKLVISKKKILFIGGPVGLERNFSILCKKYNHYHVDHFTDGFFTNFRKSENNVLHINSLEDRPSLVFFFDISKNEKVKNDILRLNIPIMAFVNTKDALAGIDYPIPANVQSWKGGIFLYNLIYSMLAFKTKNNIFC